MTTLGNSLKASWDELDLTRYPYTLVAEPFPDWGAPGIEYETMADGELVDGEVVRSDRAGNRTASFRVMVEGPNAAAFEASCAALERVADRARSVLTIDEGRVGGTPWALDAFRSTLDPDLDMSLEADLLRVYAVTMPAAPFVRSASEVVSVATFDGGSTVPTITSLYDRAAITGWTALGGSIAAATGGGVAVARGDLGSISLTSPAYDWSTDRWLAVELSAGPNVAPPSANWGSGPRASNATFGGVYFWHMDAAPTGGRVKIETFVRTPGDLTVRSVKRLDRPPILSSPRQLVRSIDIQGTTRTPASLKISHPTAGLERVLAFTWPDDGSGYQPSCSPFLVDDDQDTAASTAAWSGKFTTLTTVKPARFLIPVGQVPPGLYRAVARMRAAGTTTRSVSLTAWTRTSAVDYAQQTIGTGVGFTGSSPRIVDLGRVTLPTAATPANSTSVVHVLVTTTGDVDLDELLLFNLATGSYTSLGAGAARSVWLDSPALDDPHPRVWVADSDDKTAARHLEQSAISAWGRHLFPAGTVNVYTACSGDYAPSEASYYVRGRHSLDL